MKRGTKLLVLLLILVLLGGATFAATKLNPENQETTAEEDYETLFTVDASLITSLSWTYNGESLTFTCSDGVWSYADDPGFPLDETYLNTMASAISEVSVSKTIETPEDLSQYGLDEPVCTISVTAGDTVTEVSIGNGSAVDGLYYLSTGDGSVYLEAKDATLLDSFAYGLYDLVQTETIPAMSNVTQVAVSAETQELNLSYLEDSGLSYSGDHVWFQKTADGWLTLDTELTEDFVSSLTGLAWEECVDYRADETDLAAYGLDSPTAQVTITYTVSVTVDTGETDDDGNAVTETEEQARTFSLDIGGYADDGCYARIAGSDMVYLIGSSVSDTLLYTTAADLLPDEVLAMDWDTVESVDVTVDGVTYEILRSFRSVTDDEGTTTVETVYTLNGEEVEFADVLTDLNALTSSGYATGVTPERNEEIRFLFHRSTDTHSEVELVLYQYDSSICLVTLDGSSTVFASRTDVMSIVEAVNGIVLA